MCIKDDLLTTKSRNEQFVGSGERSAGLFQGEILLFEVANCDLKLKKKDNLSCFGKTGFAQKSTDLGPELAYVTLTSV